MLDGRLFQSQGAATEKVRSALVVSSEFGTERSCSEDDLSDLQAEYGISISVMWS